MEFVIFVYSVSSTRHLRLKAEMIYKSGQIERYKVSGKNRSVILQNNYPLIENRSSKKGRIQWKLIHGLISDEVLLSSIIKELEYKRKEMKSNLPHNLP